MTETPEEFRQRAERMATQFFENFEKRAGPHRDRGFDYEKLAVDYSNKGFQNLTYLNGGALVAIPAAMAFFKADVPKTDIMWTAVFFIAGLLAVVLAQGAAFFTMAKRSESQENYKNEQFNRIAALSFNHESPYHVERLGVADTERAAGNRKIDISN